MRIEFLRNKDNPWRATVATPEGEAAWVNVLRFKETFLSFGQEYRHVDSMEVGWDGYDSEMRAIYERVLDGCRYAIPWRIDGSGYFDYSESDIMIPVAKRESGAHSPGEHVEEPGRASKADNKPSIIIVDPLFVQIEGVRSPKSGEEAYAQWKQVLYGKYSRVFIRGEAFALVGCYADHQIPPHISGTLCSVHTVFRREADGESYGARWFARQDREHADMGDQFVSDSQILWPGTVSKVTTRQFVKEGTRVTRFA